MRLEGKRVVLTGAAGGMGQLMATALADAGSKLVLADLNAAGLERLQERLGGGHVTVAGDLGIPEGRTALLRACRDAGGADILINAAGLGEFALFEEQSAERIELMVRVNLVVPMLLSRALLPLLLRSSEPAIVNIGSAFGSIGHPGFVSYCASKFGLRGFTESLRRELGDTPVRVIHLAPRAVRTDMNSPGVVALNRDLGNAMDPPERVVDELLARLRAGRPGEYTIGWPERLFVRLNRLWPGLVDSALGKQLAKIKRHATGAPGPRRKRTA